MMLGGIAIRCGEELVWDAPRLRFHAALTVLAHCEGLRSCGR
jgi:hypothetical protein